MSSRKLFSITPLILALTALLSGCAGLGPAQDQTQDSAGIDPEEVKPGETQAAAEDSDTSEAAEIVKMVEAPGPPLTVADEDYQEQKASLASADDVKVAFSALHQVLGGAFMESVMERVESIMGLEFGKEGTGRVYRCPDSGVFVHSREEFHSHDSAESAFLFEFDDCRGSFLDGRMATLNGSYSRRIVAVSGTETKIELAYDLDGVIHDAEGDRPLRLRGTQDKRQPAEGGSVRTTPALELMFGDHYVALLDFSEEIVVGQEASEGSEFPSFSSTFETVYSGRLVSSTVGGYVDVSTPEHLVRSYPPCAAQGAYHFRGEQSAEVRFGASTNTPDWATIEIDSALMESYPDCQSFAREIGLGM